MVGVAKKRVKEKIGGEMKKENVCMVTRKSPSKGTRNGG